MANILGINNGGWDTSAALVCDGRVVNGVTEGRLIREKQSKKFPNHAIDWCLEEAGMLISDIDVVAIGWNPAINLERAPKGQIEFARFLPEFFYSTPAHLLNRYEQSPDGVTQNFSFGHDKNLVLEWITHHEAHAALAYFSSQFDQAAVLTADAFGERECLRASIGCGTKLDRLWSVDFPQSLGMFYSTMTQFLGFTPASDEWKVMAMGAFGDHQRYAGFMNEIICLLPEGRYEIDLSCFDYHLFSRRNHYTSKITNSLGSPRSKETELEQRHFDIAASVQYRFEEVMVHIVSELYRRSSLDSLCIAGGLALNTLANGRLLERTPFKELYVPFAPDDSGTSIGAALAYHHRVGGERSPPLLDARIGPVFSDGDILATLKQSGLPFRRTDNIANEVAVKLYSGQIVAWFQDRLEFGPRALGARSILADPRSAKAKELINSKVKFREYFRPFAASVLAEFQQDYFVQSAFTPFMECVYMVKQEWRESLEGVLNTDGTSRIQSVPSNYGIFRKMIEEFHKLSGLPLVLNTSLNTAGEDIVSAPTDAIHTFVTSGLDVLAIGSYIVEKCSR